jgi:uncharacterized protein (DUF362 family)
VQKYKVKLVDLNLGGYEYRYTIGADNAPTPIRICAPFLDPNLYIISTAIMKTHGFASVTLSLKNMLLGAPINDYKVSDKPHMHMGPHGEPNDIIHFNMFHMAQHVFPDLSVIDGFTGMEGAYRRCQRRPTRRRCTQRPPHGLQLKEDSVSVVNDRSRNGPGKPGKD